MSDPLIQPTPSREGPPGLRLTAGWLTVCLIVVTLVPVALAATVWLAVPRTPEPVLPAEVSWEPVAWPPQGGVDVRLMPGVRIHNPTQDRWTNVSLSINSQFYFNSPEPLAAGDDFRVPLAFFRTSGNQAYRPGAIPIKKLTIYAQLPTGRRAILDVTGPQLEGAQQP